MNIYDHKIDICLFNCCSIRVSKESFVLMRTINDYSALLVNEMRKHPGTNASGLDDRLCFISYKARLNSKYGEELGICILLSKIIKSEKNGLFSEKRRKNVIKKKYDQHYSPLFERI